jgi:hypothetical protein
MRNAQVNLASSQQPASTAQGGHDAIDRFPQGVDRALSTEKTLPKPAERQAET